MPSELPTKKPSKLQRPDRARSVRVQNQNQCQFQHDLDWTYEETL
jgi:hypothetical protein